jgi:hypothetical protein
MSHGPGLSRGPKSRVCGKRCYLCAELARTKMALRNVIVDGRRVIKTKKTAPLDSPCHNRLLARGRRLFRV